MSADTDTHGFSAFFQRLFEGPFGKFVLPALVLQSVLIGGGYATGREIVEFGAQYGAAGWLSVLTIFLGFTIMAILTFEFARLFQVYDYKSFISELIWKFWPLFDLLFLVMAVLVIAIMAAAAGEIVEETVGVPYLATIVIIIALVGILTYFGGRLIEEFKTIGTFLLYLGYIIFGLAVLIPMWGDVTATFAAWETGYVDDASLGPVLQSGILYVGYNLVVFPAVFFALHRQATRTETVVAGILAGLLMTIPFALTYLALMAFYPAENVMGAGVPWLPMLEEIGGGWLVVLYGIVVGWTLIETSVGLIHAVIDRIDKNIEDVQVAMFGNLEGLSRMQSGALGMCILVGALLLAQVGIIPLIAQGYTMMAYFFLALFALPLLTIGLYRIVNPDWKREFWEQAEPVE